MIWPFKREALATDEESNLGNVLTVVMDVVTQTELDHALSLHLQSGAPLGTCLLKAGYLNEEDLETALRYQKELRNGKAVSALVEAISTRVERKQESRARLRLDPHGAKQVA
jgi:hypothetical protein